MGEGQVEVVKRDALGRVEKVELDGVRALRRVACGGALPGSRLVARLLAARERRALRALAGLPGVPSLVDDARLAAATPPGARAPAARDVHVRGWIEGRALHQAEALPVDFFERLDELVLALHARGVCHNDLHKEQNVLVAADGRPALVDFQLASVHRRRGALFASRARDDLRHVEKHRRRYTRAGRGPAGAATRGEGHGLRRSALALVWRRTAKPLYVFVTRSLLGTRDGEARRPEAGPWPAWLPPVGPRRDGA